MIRNPADVRLERLARQARETHDPAALAQLLQGWARIGSVAQPDLLDVMNQDPLIQVGLEGLARNWIGQAFEDAVSGPRPPFAREGPGQWESEVDYPFKHNFMAGPRRYWGWSMKKDRHVYSDMGISDGDFWTPTGAGVEFAGRLVLLPCLRPRPWECPPTRQDPGFQVPAVLLTATLYDYVARYNLRYLRGGQAQDAYSFGLGRWSYVDLRLTQTLSERFYPGMKPLSGWNFDSPFWVKAGPSESEGEGSEGHYLVKFVIEVAHPLTPVVVRTPQPEAPGLALDIPVGPWALGAVAEAVGSPPRRPNPVSAMTKSVQEARRTADFWITLEDFVRFLDFNRPNQVSARRGLALFSASDWFEFSARARPGEPKTLARRFERWKAGDARPRGALVRLGDMDPGLADWAEAQAYDLGLAKTDAYFIPLEGLPERAREASRRYDELADAAAAATGRPRRREPAPAPLPKIERTATVRDVMAHFGAPYHTVIEWANKQGAPHERRPGRIKRSGKPTKVKYYYFNLEEMDAWRRQRKAFGKIPEKERVPIAEASRILNEVRDTLNLTLQNYADLLGVNVHSLRGLLEPRSSARRRAILTAPKSVVDRAKFLLETETRRPTRYESQLSATPEAVREALERTGGIREQAALLLGIARGSVTRIADFYGITYRPTQDPLITQFSRQDIRDAMVKARHNVKQAARLLGLSPPSLDRLISTEHGYGMEEEFEPFRVRKGVRPTRERMTEAISEAKGNLKLTAKILGINTDLVSKLAREWGLSRRFKHPLRLTIPRKKVLAALKKAKKLGLGKTRVGPELLNVSTNGLKRLVKDYGLQKEFEALSRGGARRGPRPQRSKQEAEAWLAHAEAEGLSAQEAAQAAGVSYGTFTKYVKLHGLHERMKKIRKSRRFVGK